MNRIDEKIDIGFHNDIVSNSGKSRAGYIKRIIRKTKKIMKRHKRKQQRNLNKLVVLEEHKE